MIPNLQPNTTYAVHLRAPSTSGGKDWVGSITAQGEVHTYWGRTNQINQHAAKPGGLSELTKIIDEKKRGKDKYSMVDEFTPQQGWRSQGNQAPVSTSSKPKAQLPTVDWVEAPAESIQWDF